MDIGRKSSNSGRTRVVIAMSGGVDSSVAAALLKKRGFEVIGVMLRLWSEAETSGGENVCCAPDAMLCAQQTADMLGLPLYVLDARQLFKAYVVEPFVAAYAAGLTPNPCLECNRRLRWGYLLEQALALGAQYLATGHYARVVASEETSPEGTTAPIGHCRLLKGIDERKDQSYVLSGLTQAQLAHALLPLGEYTKEQVRRLAQQRRLPAAERPESQDLCFVAGGDYRRLLAQAAPQAIRPGPIVRRDGRQIGEHRGLPLYTIGQRKGLGIVGPEPLYVLEIQPETNSLVVGTEAELGRRQLAAAAINWISGAPPAAPLRAQVKTRYTAKPAWATITPTGADMAEVVFAEPARGITPGQSAVFYAGEVCLGGGVIQRQ